MSRLEHNSRIQEFNDLLVDFSAENRSDESDHMFPIKSTYIVLIARRMRDNLSRRIWCLSGESEKSSSG